MRNRLRETRMVQPCGSGETGGDGTGNKVATFAETTSETGGMRANPNVGSTFSQLRRILKFGGLPKGGGGGFPEPGVRIRGIGAHQVCDRGRRPAITREADNSHVRYTFLVEKSNGEANTGIKYIYIWKNNHYIW